MSVAQEGADNGASRAVGRTTAGTTPDAAGLDPRAWKRSLFGALVDAARGPSGKAAAVEDQTGQSLDRRRLILAAAVLGRRLAQMTRRGEKVGVLLPNVNGAAVAIFALAA